MAEYPDRSYVPPVRPSAITNRPVGAAFGDWFRGATQGPGGVVAYPQSFAPAGPPVPVVAPMRTPSLQEALENPAVASPVPFAMPPMAVRAAAARPTAEKESPASAHPMPRVIYGLPEFAPGAEGGAPQEMSYRQLASFMNAVKPRSPVEQAQRELLGLGRATFGSMQDRIARLQAQHARAPTAATKKELEEVDSPIDAYVKTLMTIMGAEGTNPINRAIANALARQQQDR